MKQTSFTYVRDLEVNGGSNTDRTLAQGPVSSFDQGDCVWRDRTLIVSDRTLMVQCPVESSKVPEGENPDRRRLISVDRKLVRFWLLTER